MSKAAFVFLVMPGAGLVLFFKTAAEAGLPSPLVLVVPLIVILLLVLINGFFVAAEFAIIGVRPTQMEQMALAGDKRAEHVLYIIEHRREQDKYIATAQLGITIASLGLGMYAEPQIAHFIEPYMVAYLGLSETAVASIGYVLALSFVTYLHVVLGEMIPKALALTDAVNIVRTINPIMTLLSDWVMKYPVALLNGIGNLILRLLKVPPASGHERVLSPEELEIIVTESAESGLLNEEEEEMIRNIFDFSDRTVGQVMTPRPKVQAIPHTISYDALLKLVAESRHSRFPVYQEDRDHIIGILHVKDLVRQAMKSEGKFDLRLILRSAPAVPEDLPVERLLAAFKRQKLHMAIVLDEFGGMAGIVTLEDLVEEIVGEVRDEFDLEKEPYIQIAPGIIEVAGTYLVDDLREEIYLGEDDELPDVETVGGLVVAALGRPPKVGDSVTYMQNVVMSVIATDKRAVSRVRIEYPVHSGGGESTEEE
jgi:CBS domain containing-hemolysin-like protein